MALWIIMFVVRLDDMSLTPRTHTVKRKNCLLHIVFWCSHSCCDRASACLCPVLLGHRISLSISPPYPRRGRILFRGLLLFRCHSCYFWLWLSLMCCWTLEYLFSFGQQHRAPSWSSLKFRIPSLICGLQCRHHSVQAFINVYHFANMQSSETEKLD